MLDGLSSSSSSVKPKLPSGTRRLLVVMRSMVGIAACFPALMYCMTLVLMEIMSNGSWNAHVIYGIDVPLWLRLIYLLVLVIPFSVIGYLATRDLVKIASRCAQVISVLISTFVYGSMFLMFGGAEMSADQVDAYGIGAIVGPIAPLIAAILYPIWIIIANTEKRRAQKIAKELEAAIVAGTTVRKSEHATRSRVGLLYDRHLGIRGKQFVWKVFVVQLITVLLQTPSKLPTFAGMSTLGSPWGYGIMRIPHMIFMAALFINCIYPPILLRASSVKWQREIAATLDVYLDVVYIWTFIFTAFSGNFGAPFPIHPWAYLSCFWPVVHVFTASRALEAAVSNRLQEQQAKASGRVANVLDVRSTRLPRWGSVLYLLLTLGFFGFNLVQTSIYWPFAKSCGGGTDWGWCACNPEGNTLISCRNAPKQYLTSSAVFRGLDLKEVRGNTFDSPQFAELIGLDFSHNKLASLDPQTFDGLDSLKTLDVSYNSLTKIDATLLDGLGSLRYLNLGNNAISSVESGAFVDCTKLELVLIVGNAIKCTDINSELPEGAVCIDDGVCDLAHCSEFHDNRQPPQCQVWKASHKSFHFSDADEATAKGEMTCRAPYKPHGLFTRGNNAECELPSLFLRTHSHTSAFVSDSFLPIHLCP